MRKVSLTLSFHAANDFFFSIYCDIPSRISILGELKKKKGTSPISPFSPAEFTPSISMHGKSKRRDARLLTSSAICRANAALPCLGGKMRPLEFQSHPHGSLKRILKFSSIFNRFLNVSSCELLTL